MHVAIPIRSFSDLSRDTDDPNVKWVQAWRYSSWNHPVYGKIEVTPKLVTEFKEHLDKNTYGQDILVNYDHGLDPAKGQKAAGKVVDIEARQDGGWYKVEFTPTALAEIEAGEWRYISPEYRDTWKDAESETEHKNVPVGLAITNRPFIKNMSPMNFSELYSEVDDKEDEKDMNPLLKAFAEMLGIKLDENVTEEDALKQFSEGVTELKTKAESNDNPPPDDDGGAGGDGDDEEKEKLKKFAEQFPEQAAELASLRTMRIANEARQFAEQFSTIKVKEGDKEVTKGLSAAAKDKLTDIHLKFSEGTATAEDVAEVIKSVVSDGVVEFGERGTSATGGETPVDSKAAATQLRDRAKQLVEEAGGPSKLSFGDALATASEEKPELAAAYREGR